jgi:hypothetical protein
LAGAFLSGDGIRNFSLPMIPTEESDLYAYAAYSLMSSASVARVQNSIEKGGSFSFRAQELRSVIDIMTEYLAWDMALRSEILTDGGSTSPLLFLKQSAFSPRDVYEEVEGIGNASRTELLRIISTYQSIANVLNYLILENEVHTKKLNAIEVGIKTREYILVQDIVKSIN